MRDTIQAIQHSYAHYPDLLRGSDPSDLETGTAVVIYCHKDPSSQKHLEAVLSFDGRDAMELQLTAKVGWSRHVDGYSLMDEPPLWTETLALEEADTGSSSSTATDEGD
jgi:hypothetical protein